MLPSAYKCVLLLTLVREAINEADAHFVAATHGESTNATAIKFSCSEFTCCSYC